MVISIIITIFDVLNLADLNYEKIKRTAVSQFFTRGVKYFSKRMFII